MAETAPNNVTSLATTASTSLTEAEGKVLERIVINNDLAALSPADRVTYYYAMCRMVGVNPLNRPFEFLDLDGGLQLYASRRCGDELRRNHAITIQIVSRELMLDGQVLRVTARATFPDGRTDESDGVVPMVKEEIALDAQGKQIWKTGANNKRYPEKTGRYVPLDPAAYANAVMKAETKAKRRVTLSAVGLGILDESEIETIRNARPVQFDLSTGEVVDGQSYGFAHGDLRSEPPSVSPADLEATYRQRNLIQALARELKLSNTALDALCREQTGRDVNNLTRKDASKVVELLKERGEPGQGLAKSRSTATTRPVPPREPTDAPEERGTNEDGKAIHYRTKISTLTEPLGWEEADLDAIALTDFVVPYLKLTGDQLRSMYVDLEKLKEDSALSDFLQSVRSAREAVPVDVDGEVLS